MSSNNQFSNDNDLVNPEDIYSPTEKEVREYVEMGYSRSGAISSLTTIKRNRTEKLDQEYDPYEEGDAERMDAIRNPRVSMEDMMLKVNQHYGPPSKEG